MSDWQRLSDWLGAHPFGGSGWAPEADRLCTFLLGPMRDVLGYDPRVIGTHISRGVYLPTVMYQAEFQIAVRFNFIDIVMAVSGASPTLDLSRIIVQTPFPARASDGFTQDLLLPPWRRGANRFSCIVPHEHAAWAVALACREGAR